jgi:glycosyltransferase involved in cell wall biosynthesis
MHILLVHQAFAALDEAGGTRHHELARFLVKRGHRVTIIASPVSYLTGKENGDKPNHLPEPGITILRAYTYTALHRSFIHRVISFLSFMLSSFLLGLRVHDVDLVWGTSPPIFQGITAWLLARLKRTPFLFEVRDLWPAFAIAVGILRNKILIRSSLWLEKFLYRQADCVMVNSPGYIDHVRQRGARQVELVQNGVDPDMFDPAVDGQTFRCAHDLQGKFIVVYAGAHGMSNDLGMVLQAADLLRNETSIRLVLIGDGKEKKALQARARELNLPNLIFIPPAAKDEMPAVLAAADACIAILLPIELYKTTYPNKVFDYMAAGRPVVLAIDGVIRQVVEAAGAGIFVQPGNAQEMAQAILSMSLEPQKAHQMGLAGRSFVEKHFSRAESAEKLALLIEKLGRKNG